jgi:hypothetical protein
MTVTTLVGAASPDPTELLKAVAASIARHRFVFSDEAALQKGLAESLLADGFGVDREVRLGARNRVDLRVTRPGLEAALGLEVKIDGTQMSVVRQLDRYAASPDVDALVLVTNRVRHLQMPPTLRGKPVVVLNLLGGAFG